MAPVVVARGRVGHRPTPVDSRSHERTQPTASLVRTVGVVALVLANGLAWSKGRAPTEVGETSGRVRIVEPGAEEQAFEGDGLVWFSEVEGGVRVGTIPLPVRAGVLDELPEPRTIDYHATHAVLVVEGSPALCRIAEQRKPTRDVGRVIVVESNRSAVFHVRDGVTGASLAETTVIKSLEDGAALDARHLDGSPDAGIVVQRPPSTTGVRVEADGYVAREHQFDSVLRGRDVEITLFRSCSMVVSFERSAESRPRILRLHHMATGWEVRRTVDVDAEELVIEGVPEGPTLLALFEPTDKPTYGPFLTPVQLVEPSGNGVERVSVAASPSESPPGSLRVVLDGPVADRKAIAGSSMSLLAIGASTHVPSYPNAWLDTGSTVVKGIGESSEFQSLEALIQRDDAGRAVAIFSDLAPGPYMVVHESTTDRRLVEVESGRVSEVELELGHYVDVTVTIEDANGRLGTWDSSGDHLRGGYSQLVWSSPTEPYVRGPSWRDWGRKSWSSYGVLVLVSGDGTSQTATARFPARPSSVGLDHLDPFTDYPWVRVKGLWSTWLGPIGPADVSHTTTYDSEGTAWRVRVALSVPEFESVPFATWPALVAWLPRCSFWDASHVEISDARIQLRDLSRTMDIEIALARDREVELHSIVDSEVTILHAGARVFVVPPPHPELGALVPAWSEPTDKDGADSRVVLVPVTDVASIPEWPR